MMVQSAGIESLPNELFVHILISFPTRALLPLASISHRFHDLVLRILHNRLFAATALEDHKLILECFHPSAKLITPGLVCDYLGTDGLIDELEGQGKLYDEVERIGRLGKLASLYSQFHPVGPEQDGRPRRRRYPAGDVPTYPNNSTGYSNATAHDLDRVPSQIINLEPHELFSQLCTIANLVKIVPNVGFLINCVTIGEGVIRVWRDWLATHAVLPDEKKKLPMKEPSYTNLSTPTADDRWSRVLWLDEAKNIGIRLRVIDREDLGSPILLGIDEDVHVAYSIEFEELVIRTTQLLLKVEESLLQDNNDSGNAIVRIL